MKVSKVGVEGFRSIRKTSAALSAFQALIGPNSCGKSNFLKALEFFFESRNRLGVQDFYQDQTGNRVSKLAVEITFEGLSAEEEARYAKYVLPDRSMRIRKIATLNAGQVGAGEYHGLRRFPKDPRYRIESYRGTASQNFDSLASAAGNVDQYRPAGRLTDGVFEATLEAVVAARAGELEFEDAEETTQFMGLKQVAASSLGQFLLLPAIPDPESEGDVRKGSKLSDLVSVVLENVTRESAAYSEAVRGMREAVSRFNTRLEDGTPNLNRPADLPRLEQELEAELSKWEVRIELEVPTPEMDALISKPAVHIDDGHKSSLQLKGHGLQRSFVLAALSVWRKHIARAQAEQSNQTLHPPVILAIEEPELYLHPQQQRDLFDLLKEISTASSTQIILSSHSPHFIDVADTRSILRTGKSRVDGTRIKQLGHPLFAGVSDKAKRDRFHLTQWINPTRGELFFARRVILVEGPTEMAVLPYAATRLGVFKRSTSIIECGGKTAIPLYVELLRAFDIEFAVVHDEDPVEAAAGTEEHGRQTTLFGVNRAIEVVVGNPAQIRCIRPEFENLIGVSETQGRKKGKPLAALEALESGTISSELETLVRWVYT